MSCAKIENINMKKNIILLSVISVVVFFTVIYGFLDGGSPRAARNKRYDDTRSQNLQMIKSSIDSFFKEESRLPASVYEVSANNRYVKDSVYDPETKEVYEYKVVTDNDYQLCTMFSTSTIGSNLKYLEPFEHPKGYFCFEFSVDKK